MKRVGRLGTLIVQKRSENTPTHRRRPGEPAEGVAETAAYIKGTRTRPAAADDSVPGTEYRRSPGNVSQLDCDLFKHALLWFTTSKFTEHYDEVNDAGVQRGSGSVILKWDFYGIVRI